MAKTGGYAFPRPATVGPGWQGSRGQEGITFREYLAAKAMKGILSNPQSWDVTVENIATIAYEQADAMIKHQNENE